MQLRSLSLLFAAVLSLAALHGCTGGGSSSADKEEDPIPEGLGRVDGAVTDGAGKPLEGVAVRAGDDTTTSDAGGRFRLDLEPGATVLRMSLGGYAPAALAVEVEEGVGQLVSEGLLQRSAPIPFDAATGGTLGTLARVTLGGGALVKADGTAAAGQVSARITPLDVTGDLRAAPGDFSARRTDGSSAALQTYGMAEYVFEDGDGNELQLADGVKATVELELPPDSGAAAGDTIPAWHFDQQSGRWVEEGQGTVAEEDGKLVWRAEVAHFSWWNADDPLEIHCVRGTVTDCEGAPVPGARITARGLDYLGQTAASANAAGEYCVRAKRGSRIELVVVGRVEGNTVGRKLELQLPDTAADCGEGGCTEQDVSLPCDPADSELDCLDSVLVACSGCLAGTVVGPDGSPPANAAVTLREQISGYAATTLVGDDGSWCLAAPTGREVEIVAQASGFPPTATTVQVQQEGQCPECQQVPPIVLQPGGGGEGWEPCTVGTRALPDVALGGADPALGELPHQGIFAVDAGPEDPLRVMVWLADTSGPQQVDGGSVLLFVFDVPRGEASGASPVDGYGVNNSGGIIGVNSELYGVYADEDRGEATWTLAGATLSGTLSLRLRTICGTALRQLSFGGTFEAPVLSMMDMARIAPCMTLAGLFGAGLHQQGVLELSVDGQPVAAGAMGSVQASYMVEADELRITASIQDLGQLTLAVNAPVAGTQALSSVAYFDQTCHHQGAELPELTVEDNGAGSLAAAPSRGSFSVEVPPVEGQSDSCLDPVTLSGTFQLAVCQ